MATYLESGVFPNETPFQPNYGFIMRTLEMKQNRYDQNFAQVKSIYNSVLNADLLREDNKERRDQIISNAEKALQVLPTIDLGVAKNVSAAKSVFKPFYQDEDILHDMAQTANNKSQISAGMALRDSSKEEDRKRYWNDGVQDLIDWQDEFKSATREQAKSMQSRRYVAKPNISDKVLDMFNTGKLKMSVDKTDGRIQYTYENGEILKMPLENLYLGLANNDPEALEGFNVMGRVRRNKFIKDNTANGMYPTRELAAEAHDQSLVKDYVNQQDLRIKGTTSAISLLDTRIKGWEQKLNDKTITPAEAQKMADDEQARDMLKGQLEQFNQNKQTAADRILRNPQQYLGNIYLNKAASDLATSLSGFGTVKRGLDPEYEKLVIPQQLEIFKTDQSIRLEQEKSKLNMQEKQFEYELKSMYGDVDGTTSGDKTTGGKAGAGTSMSELNTPEVAESISASAVAKGFRDNLGQPDAYKQNITSKRAIISELADTKASLIFEALDPGEIVDDKGKVLDQNQMRNLPKNGALLNNLYAKAIAKIDAYASSNPTKANQLLDTKLKAENLNTAWSAMDKQMNAWSDEIIGNLVASETHPEKVIETKEKVGIGRQSGGYQYKTVKKTIPGKNEGWVYNYLKAPEGHLLGEGDVDKFMANVKKDKNFEQAVNQRLAKNMRSYAETQTNAMLGNPFSQVRSIFTSAPTLEQARTQVASELKDNYTNYRNKVINEWNRRGLNFETKYAPLPGGGGTTARVVTYTGKSSVKGEMADQLVSDLLTKVPTISGEDDMFVISGPDKINASDDADETLKTLVQNGALRNEIMNSIKLGKDASLTGYRFSSSQVGSGSAEYSAYTISFDADFLSKMKGTDDKPGPIGADTDKLLNGVTIYLKKDVDNTLAKKMSTKGEIDILVNTNPQGVLQKEVLPGYGLVINKNPLTGGYKIKSYYKKITKENLEGVPTETEVSVPESVDLSTMYYRTISDLRNLYTTSQKTKEDYMKAISSGPNATVIDRAYIDALKTNRR